MQKYVHVNTLIQLQFTNKLERHLLYNMYIVLSNAVARGQKCHPPFQILLTENAIISYLSDLEFLPGQLQPCALPPQEKLIGILIFANIIFPQKFLGVRSINPTNLQQQKT